MTAALDRLLDPGRIVLFDGAMGTMLYQKGVFINQCYDELSVRSPDLVRDIHRHYVKAGAEVLETNSFGANRVKLAQYGLEGRVQELNRAAAALAREVADAADRPVLVAGAAGPLGVRLEPYGPTSVEEARAVFREQLQALKDGGADLFIVETFSDLHEIKEAIAAARDVDPTMPIVAQMTIGADHLTPYGASAEDVARALDGWGVDVIGLNCSVGPQIILECIEKMAPLTRKKLSAQPNAGMPREVGGRNMYMASPEYMASYARHLIHAGAKILGGCCGTTPEHIRAICEGIRPLNPRLEVRGSRFEVRGEQLKPQTSNLKPQTSNCRGDADPVRTAIPTGFQDRCWHLRDFGRDRATAGRGRGPHARGRAEAQGGGGRRGERPRRAAGTESHGRAADERAHRAAGRYRDGHPLCLPRPQLVGDVE